MQSCSVGFAFLSLPNKYTYPEARDKQQCAEVQIEANNQTKDVTNDPHSQSLSTKFLLTATKYPESATASRMLRSCGAVKPL